MEGFFKKLFSNKGSLSYVGYRFATRRPEMRASVDVLLFVVVVVMLLYFCIHRHNESKRRLKNVSLT